MMRKILFLLILYSFSISAQYSKEKEINYALDTIRINKVPFYVKNETDKKLALVENLYLQSKEIGYTTGQVNALLYMAATYCIRGDIDNTIVKCDEGLSLTKGKEKYALQRVNFLLAKGIVSLQMGYFEKSREDFQTASAIIDKVPPHKSDSIHYAKAYVYYCTLMSYERDTNHILGNKEIEYYALNAYKQTQQINNDFPKKKFVSTLCIQRLILAYIDQDKLDLAEKYLAQAEVINKGGGSFWPLSRNIILGAIAEKKKNYTSATKHYEQALIQSKQYDLLKAIYDRDIIYSGLTESYHALHNYEKESYYLSESKRYNDSIALVNKNTVSNILKDEVKNNTANKKINLYYIIAVLLILCLISFYIIKQIIPRIINKTHRNTQPEQEEITDFEKLSLVTELAQNNDPAFSIKFAEVFPAFNQNLLNINPRLTQSDLEFCALMKINFDTKGIAVIKKMSAEAVKSKKHRIRKKLNISPEENIYIWLMDR
ncbi:hypothetical protein KS04_13815 [Elizabethkingia miricola]|nr:hypothetical protein KS04_13815 [Elizabethkingia miricola]OPB70934.1 hypothetical protein BAY12_16295 [Elizabethkingia bruuniana]